MKHKLAYMLVGVLLGWGVACGTTNLDSLTLSDTLTAATVTASGTVSAEQLTTTDDLTVTGLATIGETLVVTGQLTAPMVQAAADPCGSLSEGTIFYDTVGNEHCYCSASSADLKLVDGTACY